MIAKSQAKWTTDAREALRAGEGFRLAELDPESTPGYAGKKADAVADLAAGLAQLGEYQERLFAASRGGDATDSVLLVLQAMDSAGKGGIVRHVVGGVDPQGVQLAAFKAPTDEERAHDFLWRIEKRVPSRGMIGVFDRSHYEDVLIGRVHGLAPAEEIERRYGAIVEFEKRLLDAGTRVVKVMLHISYEEQGERLMERLERPDKHWKYNPGDVDERVHWRAYQEAYQTAIERTSTDEAPWFVVPANRKWFARLAVQELLLETLEEIGPRWPAAEFDVAAEKRRLRATMTSEG
ncbi:PPK2 family polyphosphate kinase [Microbacterium sediminis]|uniref:Phosphate--nucleotide phosphotransferase n=1 Tax=Microbacterium sediminis TaxID=904291 RepID=A0A1B9ND95_9MICO|nr:PPK2 family polyphosphate kinase [Microbacterium sediminis]OCG74558.1 phosphate--nucleotide phosphotransferase [Microbacterium sediminis]QBR74857.1 polyphosphate kinase 2 family protein [Microbacterium sediminis]